jgi:hypothetical protein
MKIKTTYSKTNQQITASLTTLPFKLVIPVDSRFSLEWYHDFAASLFASKKATVMSFTLESKNVNGNTRTHTVVPSL